MIRRLLRTPVTWVALAVLAAAGGFGLYWFQPWKLVVDERVDETLSSPVAAPRAPTGGDPSAPASPTAPATPAGPTVVSKGEFISHEHATTGSARIIRQPDGSHQLELLNLATSNGPDLRVWLTDQPVIEGPDGWHVFDDGAWVELDILKGNQGNQVYEIPTDVDPGDYTSVSIWCKRFSVSFGAAALDRE
jgi:hypothetical protein